MTSLVSNFMVTAASICLSEIRKSHARTYFSIPIRYALTTFLFLARFCLDSVVGFW